ncbi:response regulator [Spirosoma endophyticum]|uniref:Response regulator receiver domain-containing protein n=1 Tax=Spirosoma endophyticum TaxID=662367 RepID=A0A1I2I6F4_9BACT|nr:response regulator [Spirosoma endophyticum]SFF37218.1 Response regulator receiver domain-containing protein [Spirosoma endophyticum]
MTLQQTITVLIIDDDEDDRFFMEQAFKTDSASTQVHSAAGGQQAFELLGSAPLLPDVILLDLNMPGMTGFEVLAHLKQSPPYQSIPVVILTTSDAATDQDQARQLGAAEFITKPTTSVGLSAIAQRIRFGLLE